MIQPLSRVSRSKSLSGFNSQRDIRSLLTHGRRFDGPFFRAAVLPARHTVSRFAFVVPRAVEKHATRRNRLKRRAREWFRTTQRETTRPIDAVIQFKKSAIESPKKFLYEELARFMRGADSR